MKKLFIIGLKDLTLALRDRAALILMFAAPLALTLGLGFVTGRFSGQDDDTGLRDIPVVIVNQDAGQLGAALVDVFGSPELGTLVKPVTGTDVVAAHKLVDDDQVAAAVVVPAGFTGPIIPASTLPQVVSADPGLSRQRAGGDVGRDAKNVKKIGVYANAGRPISAGVIQAIVEEFVARVEAGRVSGQVAITQLIANGLIEAEQAGAYAERIGRRQAAAATASAITINRSTSAGAPAPEFDVLAVLAPGMALLFLMYTVTRGGANLLAERDGGTLARLMVTPTGMAQIVGGKVLGVFLTSVAQVAILIVASSLLFGLRWGDPAGVIALVVAVAAGATGCFERAWAGGAAAGL